MLCGKHRRTCIRIAVIKGSWHLRINFVKIKMDKGKMIPKYLTKFTQCRDELGSVGIMVAKDDMVILALLGLPKS